MLRISVEQAASCCDYSLHIEAAGEQFLLGAREKIYRFCLIMLVMQFAGATAYKF
ncbi:hypothetical protein [Nostoc sp. C052]|uniref:hypothetical protein n=1 Tax=Nostoc sp. C052 TaxID=2576902 RepID=UPI001C4AC00F|nr:hypothetical protein [Nostoc sp. C052]